MSADKTLLGIADIVSALDGTISGPKDFDRRCRWLREQMDLYATAKAQASCEATLKKAAENGRIIREVQIDSDNKIKEDSEKFWTFKNSFYKIDKSSILDKSNITIV